MKHFFLSIIMIGCLQWSLHAQNLLWESNAGAQVRNNPTFREAASSSSLSLTNFDNDRFPDVPTQVIYRDSLFFRISRGIEGVEPLQFEIQVGTSKVYDDVTFLGFSTTAVTNAANKDERFNEIVLGLTKGENIIGILIAFQMEGSQEFSAVEVLPDNAYRFLSTDDFNDDQIQEFLIFNLDERKVQLWQF